MQVPHGVRFFTIMKTLVLGLGNTILGDDGVGICTVREMRRVWPGDPDVELVEASLGGMVLLDLIAGYDRLIIIDAIMTTDDRPVGFVYDLTLDDLGEIIVPYASHALDLKTTVELGKRLGYKMPATAAIHAIKIEENTIFREELTPPVAAVVPVLARRIIAELALPA